VIALHFLDQGHRLMLRLIGKLKHPLHKFHGLDDRRRPLPGAMRRRRDQASALIRKSRAQGGL
jgi:hypothetical protein